MSPGFESASETVAEKWEVGPTEDVVQALLEKLVDPRLPLRVSASEPPSMDSQKSVAKQMHAVVLLYNYYHRKQKPELRFLDFVSFCKLVVKLRPPLTSFMQLSISSELNSSKNPLSVTEKTIKNACNIAGALDASKNVPTIEMWRISKVSVLLVDSKRENCYLEFGLVTEGVWSLIEKSSTMSELNPEVSSEETIENRSERNSQIASSVDSYMQQGFDAVKDVTGFGSSDLVVLESHVAYALCRPYSSARFFIMQCSQPFNIKKQVPLKFLVESLQGPLAEESYGTWATTTVVEFYHLLPYYEFISHSLSRKDLNAPCLFPCNAKNTMDTSEREILEIRAQVFHDLKSNEEEFEHAGNNGDNTKGRDNLDQRAGIKDERHKRVKRCEKTDSKARVLYQRRKNTPTTQQHSSDLVDDVILNDAKANIPFYNENMELCENVTREDGGGSEMINQNEVDAAQFQKVQVMAETKGTSFIRNSQSSEDLKNALSLLYRKRHEMCAEILGMEDMLALSEDNIERIRDGGDVGLARQCIKSIINGNYPVELNREILNHWKDHHPGKDRGIFLGDKQTGFADTYLPGKSSFEDLEYICLKNDWRLPRYFVEPSDGKFLSKVVVKSKDFKLSLKGNLECNPSEARESAAERIISKLRDQVSTEH